MQIVSRTGRPILDVEGWPRPKKDYQWVEGRSAMELARRWIPDARPRVPLELVALLNSNDETQGVTVDQASREFVTELPERGEGRDHDLLIRAHRGALRITIGVEAKTDEAFDEYIGPRVSAAETRSSKTRVPGRTVKL